jgi:5'-nucleotidase
LTNPLPADIIACGVMAELDRPQILLTNDDGIRSPGLWAAAEALSSLGFVNVAAPREQSSGAGRSMPPASDGAILEREMVVGGKTWKVYAVGGTPAQAVLHAVLELMPRRPALLVSGINYGENLGTGVTVSGTVGAALEGAACGMPSLAVSLETDTRYHLTHSEEIDFSAAAHFTQFFAGMLLRGLKGEDVDVLKVDVPSDATPQTPWRVTRLSRVRYFVPIRPERERLEQPGGIGYRVDYSNGEVEQDSDIYALQTLREVAVTPLSIDLTSRIPLPRFEDELRRLTV